MSGVAKPMLLASSYASAAFGAARVLRLVWEDSIPSSMAVFLLVLFTIETARQVRAAWEMG